MALKRVDHPLAAEQAADGRDILEPVLGIEQRDHFAHQFHQAGLGKRRIEFGIVGKLEPVHHDRGEVARGQNLNLVLDRGGVAGLRRDHGRQVGDAVLAGIQHHHRRTGIKGGQHDRHRQRAQDGPQRNPSDQAAARIQQADEIGKLESRRGIQPRKAGTRRREGRYQVLAWPVWRHRRAQPSKGAAISEAPRGFNF